MYKKSGKIFQIFSTIAFVVFCICVGQVISILLTCLVYGVSASQILEALKEPIDSAKSLIISFSSFFTLFGFLIIPSLYLLVYNKSSMNFLEPTRKMRFIPLALSLLTILFIIPFISVLIEFNYHVALPVWLSEVEMYFRQRDESARQLTNCMLSFEGSKDLIIAILTMAIIPGVAEEFFFRGLVQLQLQNILRNHHYAIFFSAFLFSFFHFQFYGFIPRMVLGMLFGYLFIWSKNIWYPSAAHIIYNLIGVLGVYFWGPQFMNPESGTYTSLALLFPSLIVTVVAALYLKRILSMSQKSV